MAIWLTHGQNVVGLEAGLIRARDFAALADSATIAAGVTAERTRILDNARAQGDTVLVEARAEAAALMVKAREQYAKAYEDGLQKGLEEASAKWARQALSSADARRRELSRQSERLASIVSMAVERVIEQEDRAGLFRRSLRTIVKLVKDTPMLTLRVTEADSEIAQRAVLAIRSQLVSDLPIEVVTDAALRDGDCRFESDGGVIDAGLDTQLAALRRAVARAARQMAAESVEQMDAAASMAADAARPGADAVARGDDPPVRPTLSNAAGEAAERDLTDIDEFDDSDEFDEFADDGWLAPAGGTA